MSSLHLQQCRPGQPGPQDAVLVPSASIDGLYLHIPFCFHKCHYCDFFSVVDDSEDRQAAFTEQLIAELELRASQVQLHPRTIFAGGGTPTLLRAELWQKILDTLHRLAVLERVEEFSVEANPETVSAELLDLLVSCGVNRISIGAQSFQPQLLKTLQRWHDPARVVESVALARTAGVRNLSLDLIFAIPQQSFVQLKADLQAALALEPEHLSIYGLTYEPNTPLSRRLDMGQVAPVPEHRETAMYEYLMDRLGEAGYEQYEVSNWAKWPVDCSSKISCQVTRLDPSPWRCQHNLLYWTNANWLAIGPSGASHVNGHRWKNESHLGRYLERGSNPIVTDYEHLPAPRRVGEQLMLRLRMRDGVPLDWLDRNLSVDDPRHSKIAEWIRMDLLEQCDSQLRLTRRGLLVADSIIVELL